MVNWDFKLEPPDAEPEPTEPLPSRETLEADDEIAESIEHFLPLGDSCLFDYLFLCDEDANNVRR